MDYNLGPIIEMKSRVGRFVYVEGVTLYQTRPFDEPNNFETFADRTGGFILETVPQQWLKLLEDFSLAKPYPRGIVEYDPLTKKFTAHITQDFMNQKSQTIILRLFFITPGQMIFKLLNNEE